MARVAVIVLLFFGLVGGAIYTAWDIISLGF